MVTIFSSYEATISSIAIAMVAIVNEVGRKKSCENTEAKLVIAALEQYNDYLLSNEQVSRRHKFQSLERQYLSPLPTHRYEIKAFKKATVQKMGYVYVGENKNYYSVPYRYISKRVEVRYDRNNVEIYYKHDRIAMHKRSYKAGYYITNEDHLSSTHKFYKNWSPEFFQKLAHPHGQDAVKYITELIDKAPYPEVAYKQCLGILHLADKDNPDRLGKACRRAMYFEKSGYHIIKNIMDNKMEDQLEVLQNTEHSIASHENVRGPGYFKKLLQFFF